VNGFDFHLPTEILFGRGRVRDIGSRIPAAARRILVVTDRGVAIRTPAFLLFPAGPAALEGFVSVFVLHEEISLPVPP